MSSTDWRTSIPGPLFRELGAHHKLYRYDPRSYGLSEGGDAEISLDTLVADLEAVVDGAKLDRLATVGVPPPGRAPRPQPSRTRRAIPAASAISCSQRRSRAGSCDAPIRIPMNGSGSSRSSSSSSTAGARTTPPFGKSSPHRCSPGATPEQLAEWNELCRVSAPPRQAARAWSGPPARRTSRHCSRASPAPPSSCIAVEPYCCPRRGSASGRVVDPRCAAGSPGHQ